jgi:hypothetical protein
MAISMVMWCVCGWTAAELKSGFDNPPPIARPLAYWHWINGNVTKKGITEDLEDIKRVGMAGVQLFDVSIYLPSGPVRYGTDNWHAHVQHAIRECQRLGLEFSVKNCAGWATSGGPWITPDTSMKQFVWTETEITGQTQFSGRLRQPDAKLDYYRDIAVFAVPSDTQGKDWMKSRLQAMRSDAVETLDGLIDDDTDTVVEFPPTPLDRSHVVHLTFKEAIAARLLTVHLMTRSSRLVFKGAIEASRDGVVYDPVRTFDYRGDYTDPSELAVPFDRVEARYFRIRFACLSNHQPTACRLAQLTLSDQYRIENRASKIYATATTLHRPEIPFDRAHPNAISKTDVFSGLGCAAGQLDAAAARLYHNGQNQSPRPAGRQRAGSGQTGPSGGCFSS